MLCTTLGKGVVVATGVEVPDCDWVDVGVPYEEFDWLAGPLDVDGAPEALEDVAARLFDELPARLLDWLDVPNPPDIAVPVLLIDRASEPLVDPVFEVFDISVVVPLESPVTEKLDVLTPRAPLLGMLVIAAAGLLGVPASDVVDVILC